MTNLIARDVEIGVPENIKLGVQINEKMVSAIIAKAYEIVPEAVAHDKARLEEERHVVVVRMYVWETEAESSPAALDVEGVSFEASGNAVRITDETNDSVLFERPITNPSQGHFLFLVETREGVYITRAQWDALTRVAEAWFEDGQA